MGAHAAGTHFACKTIPKIPKRGKGTPRYLLKLQTEVDAMVQLGPSLDAVFLKVRAAELGVCMHPLQTLVHQICHTACPGAFVVLSGCSLP